MPRKRELDYSRRPKDHYEEMAKRGEQETTYGVWHKTNIASVLAPEASRTHYKLRKKARERKPKRVGIGSTGRSRDVLN